MQTANVISALVQVLRQTKNNPLGIFDLTIKLVTGLYKTKAIALWTRADARTSAFLVRAVEITNH
jgi:hypothetical protein